MRPLPTIAILCTALALLGCPPDKTPASPATAPSPVAARNESEGTLVDPADRCRVVPAGCPGTDGDGCPDVVLHLGPDCHVDPASARVLAAVADDIQYMKPLTLLAIVAARAPCIEVVRNALVHNGVASGRLQTEVRSDRGDSVTFQVASWSGARCN